MTLFTPPARALAQIDDPAFLRVIGSSVLWTIAAFAALTLAVAWGAQRLVASHVADGVLSWMAGLLTGVGAVAAALYFFVAVASVVATLFVDPVARAVERRYYPYLPPARPAPFSQQLWDGLALGLRVLLLQIMALVLTPLLPGIAALLGWAIAAWAIGRGLFVAVAMRRMDRRQAMALYAANRLSVIGQGALVAAGSMVPLLNLAMPVLGAAVMVHVLDDAWETTRLR